MEVSMAEAEARPRIVWGAEAIGAVIGVNKAKAYYLLQRGRIPARKVGDEWVAEETKLLAFLTDTDGDLGEDRP
jgi:hypothetical protein